MTQCGVGVSGRDPPPSLAIVAGKCRARWPGCAGIRADASARISICCCSGPQSTDIVADSKPAPTTIQKPVNLGELRRGCVGVRVVTLQERLAHKVTELQATLDKVRQLRGLLPSAANAARIRNDHNYWGASRYVTDHTDAKFTPASARRVSKRPKPNLRALSAPPSDPPRRVYAAPSWPIRED
jgi:hypothetical protein